MRCIEHFEKQNVNLSSAYENSVTKKLELENTINKLVVDIKKKMKV